MYVLRSLHLFQVRSWCPRVQFQSLHTQYHNSWSPCRTLLVKKLLGAESVLARLLHEANSSRMFTPVGLGEILESRAHAADGQLNVLAQKKTQDKALGWRRTGETPELVEVSVSFIKTAFVRPTVGLRNCSTLTTCHLTERSGQSNPYSQQEQKVRDTTYLHM